MTRVLILKTAHRGIPIYRWYSSDGSEGLAVVDFDDEEKYNYFESVKKAKKYIDEELSAQAAPFFIFQGGSGLVCWNIPGSDCGGRGGVPPGRGVETGGRIFGGTKML